MNPLHMRILRTVTAAFPAIVPHLKGRARWVALSGNTRIHQRMVITGTWEAKTYENYLYALNRAVADLYNSKISEDDFIDKLAELIPEQLRDAWIDGMEDAGLTRDDITPEWEEQIQNIIADEFDFVDSFAQDIVEGRDGDIAEFQARAELWAVRYQQVRNIAALAATASLGGNMKWVEGDTVKKCPVCVALDGIIAGANEWEELGVRPQNGPNPALSNDPEGCGGWKCMCELQPTDEPRTPNAKERILEITGM